MTLEHNSESPYIQTKISDTSAQDIYLKNSEKRKVIKVYISIAIALSVIGFSLFSALRHHNMLSTNTFVSQESIRTAIVHRGTLERDIVVQGRIVTANSPTLYSPESGTIKLIVKQGNAVSKGELLGRISSQSIDEELVREESTLSKIKIDLQRQKIEAKRKKMALKQIDELSLVNLKAKQRDMQRSEAANKLSLISQIDFLASQDELEKATLQHNQAQKNYSLEKEMLNFETQTLILQIAHQNLIIESLLRRKNELDITSPVKGMIGNIQVNNRSAVVANQPLITIIDLTNFEVEAKISQGYADELLISMETEIRLNGKNFTGEIIGISPEVINNEVITRIRFTGEKPKQLRQNQRVTSRIILERKAGALLLKKGSLMTHFQGKFFKVTSNQATRTPVTVGSASVSHIEITSGLEPNDEIIISSPDIDANIQTILITN